MATAKKRKKALPPWLNGVVVSSRSGAGNKQEHSVSDGAKSLKTECFRTDAAKPSKEMPTPEDKDVILTAEQIVELSYPKFSFTGSIVYSYNKDDCNLLCDDFLSELDQSTECYIGFDTEWPVTYERGKSAKTALIQVCPSEDKCYLFHVSCMSGFPSMLKRLIEAKNIKKIGLNIEYDLWKLEADYDIKAKDIIQSSAIELRTLANRKLHAAENWSLEGLAKNTLKLRISKDPDVRKCDWSQFPLPQKQQLYAASDAAISLMVYKKLCENSKSEL